MGYFMRYIITSDQPITLARIEAGLQALDPAYAITNVQFDDLGDLMYGDQPLVAAEIFWPGTEAEPVLEKVDRLWNWLFTHYDGLLQADNEGFYDAHDLILPRNFTL
mgnify:CR=1 FL=1